MNGRDERVIEEFRRRRTRQLTLAVPLIAVVLYAAFTGEGDALRFGPLSESVSLSIFISLIAGAILFSFVNWRCPSCNRYLGRSINPSYCQKCGAQLRD